MDEKTLLGLAYIFQIVPILNFVGIILLIVGWYKLGKKHEKKIWKYAGFSGIAGIIGIILLIPAFLAGLSAGSTSAIIGSILTGSFVAIVLMLLFAVIQLIALWTAGEEFESTLLKVSAILILIPFANFVSLLLAGIGFLTLSE